MTGGNFRNFSKAVSLYCPNGRHYMLCKDTVKVSIPPWNKIPGPRLNIKTVLPSMGIPMLKLRWPWDRLIFNMGFGLDWICLTMTHVLQDILHGDPYGKTAPLYWDGPQMHDKGDLWVWIKQNFNIFFYCFQFSQTKNCGWFSHHESARSDRVAVEWDGGQRWWIEQRIGTGE